MTDATDNRLNTLIERTPRQLEPSQPLWDRIEARLDVPQQGKPGFHWRALTVACSLLLMFLFSYRILLPQTQQRIATVQPASQTLTVDALQALLLRLDAEHKQQVSSLETDIYSVSWRQSQYSTPLETGLRELREAAKQIYRNLHANPRNKQLWELWLWVQKREIDLLQQGQKLPRQTELNTI